MTDELPEGFSLQRGAFASLSLAEVEDALLWSQRSMRAFGGSHLMPRLTAYCGTKPYAYSNGRHEPAPIPPVVDVILAVLDDALGVEFNSILGNLYRDGRDSIAWHADDEPELGPEPVIASVSLGAPRAFLVRRRDDRQAPRWITTLKHGDLLVMSGRSQLDYEHSVPKRAASTRRINLTFRSTLW